MIVIPESNKLYSGTYVTELDKLKNMGPSVKQRSLSLSVYVNILNKRFNYWISVKNIVLIGKMRKKKTYLFNLVLKKNSPNSEFFSSFFIKGENNVVVNNYNINITMHS